MKTHNPFPTLDAVIRLTANLTHEEAAAVWALALDGALRPSIERHLSMLPSDLDVTERLARFPTDPWWVAKLDLAVYRLIEHPQGGPAWAISEETGLSDAEVTAEDLEALATVAETRHGRLKTVKGMTESVQKLRQVAIKCHREAERRASSVAGG